MNPFRRRRRVIESADARASGGSKKGNRSSDVKLSRPRITIGQMMVGVALVALVSAIVLAIPPAIDPLMRDRGIRMGAGTYVVVVTVLTCVVAAPLIAAVALFFSAVSRGRLTGRPPVRRWLASIALFGVGLAMIFRPLPLDGLRHAEWV